MAALQVAVELVHVTANVSLLKISATNPAAAASVSGLRLRLDGTGANLTAAAAAGAAAGGGVDFALPAATSWHCFDPAVYASGALRLPAAAEHTAAAATGPPHGGDGRPAGQRDLVRPSAGVLSSCLFRHQICVCVHAVCGCDVCVHAVCVCVCVGDEPR